MVAADRHWLERLREGCETATRPVAFIGVLGMLIAAGVTVVDVLLRWLVNGGITALNEIVGMVFSVAVVACLPAGMARGVNLSVDVLEKRFSPRLATGLKAWGSVALLLFFALFTWRMFGYEAAMARDNRATTMLLLPVAPFMLAAALLLALATLVQLVIATDDIRRAAALKGAIVAGPLDVAALAAVAGLAALAVLGAADFGVLVRWTQAHTAAAITLAVGLTWVLLLGLMPLATVLGLMGLVGCAAYIGFEPAFSAMVTEGMGFLSNYEVAALPLFLLMGSFAAVGGVAEDVYRLAQALLGSFRGGLAMATIAGCAGFGAVTGSSLATVATFGYVALPEMRARGYAPHFALGCVAAGGTLGALIPPSGPLIIFALLTEASIGQLFIAAMIPGLLAACLYLAATVTAVRVQAGIVPPAARAQTGELLAALRRSGAVAVLFGAVIGGMYSGIFTATEAAAVGAFGAFLVALIRGRLGHGVFWRAMAETTASTAMIYGLIFGVLTFSFFVNVSELPDKLMELVGGLRLAPLAIVGLILLVYLFLGCVMDSFTVMVITVPIVTPIIMHFGYDIVWWGIINLVVIETGLITPPFGLHLFVLKSMNPEVGLGAIYRGVLPFCVADFVKLLLLVLIPAISTWLPSTMFQ
jgi:tripartite ATP-independent transporter DctM subunit